MIYIIVVAVLGIIIMTYYRFQKSKHDVIEKDALQLAWENKDYDAYIDLINEKIEKTGKKKDKNVLATLKMQVYVMQKDWDRMNALKKQVKTKDLPKKIQVTFLTQYIIGLCLSGEPQKALKWMEIEEVLFHEAEANGTYTLYINTLKALKAFYREDYGQSKQLFTDLDAKNINDNFYAPLFRRYLKKIEAAATPQITE